MNISQVANTWYEEGKDFAWIPGVGNCFGVTLAVIRSIELVHGLGLGILGLVMFDKGKLTRSWEEIKTGFLGTGEGLFLAIPAIGTCFALLVTSAPKSGSLSSPSS